MTETPTPLREVTPVAIDTVGALRRLADAIEADIKDGLDVRAVVVVTLTGNKLDAMSYGKDGHLPQACTMLTEVANRIARGYD